MEAEDKINTINHALVTVGMDESIMIVNWRPKQTKEQALNMAAWIVALADPTRKRFDKVFEAVCNT